MSFIGNLKGTLKSLVGKKTDKVVAESEVKMEEAPAPVVEVMDMPETLVTHVDEVIAPTHIDTAVDNVTVAVEEATADLENIHTENH